MVHILVYAPDGVGCGHVSRMANFVDVIKKHIKDPYILFVTGYYNVNYFLPESFNIDYIKLPYLNKVKLREKSNFGTIKANTCGLRKAILKTLFESIHFDYIFIDFFPFGVGDELINILKEKKKKRKIILVQRGIIFSRKKTTEFFKGDEGINFINNTYERIICFSDKKIVDLNKEYFQDRITIPVRYVGYIYNLKHNSYSNRSPDTRQKKILVNFGGSYKCDELLLSVLEELIKKVSSDHYSLTVLLGEYLKEDTKKNIINKYQKLRYIEILDFISKIELDSLECDLILGCGGYNTTISAIFNEIPIIVIPRYRGNDLEPLIHSRQLAKYSDLEIVSPDNIGKLTDLVKKSINNYPKTPNLYSFGKSQIPEIFDRGDIIL